MLAYLCLRLLAHRLQVFATHYTRSYYKVRASARFAERRGMFPLGTAALMMVAKDRTWPTRRSEIPTACPRSTMCKKQAIKFRCGCEDAIVKERCQLYKDEKLCEQVLDRSLATLDFTHRDCLVCIMRERDRPIRARIDESNRRAKEWLEEEKRAREEENKTKKGKGKEM